MAGDGSRKAIRLGKQDKKIAAGFLLRVEKLIGANITNSTPDDNTSRWVADLDNRMHDRLAAVGLVKPRASMTLGPCLESYIAGRTDAKPATHIVFGHTKKFLIEHFGAGRVMREISEGDADEFRRYLIGKKLADNTVRRRCGITKQFFKAAVRKRLIASNPFAHLKAAVQANKSREYFVSRADAQRVLDACPDAQWRLLFALSRYAGLRCPSEHLALTWKDINWARGLMLVRSCKTEHHAGVSHALFRSSLSYCLTCAKCLNRPSRARFKSSRDTATTPTCARTLNGSPSRRA